MENRNVVITGGAGFIGSNLARNLIEYNNVIIIDNLSTGRMENISDIIHKNNLVCIQGSILDRDMLEKAFRGIDFVFHQAAISSISQSISDPLLTNEVNINGTLNVLFNAKKHRIKKVVFASSSSIYGDASALPTTEMMPPDLLSPYALTKLVGEYYCDIFSKVYGLPTISLRYFNVYGPNQNPNSDYSAVIPSFISCALKNQQPVIYGDGHQTRDFIFVEDIVRANIIAAESTITGAINIGSGCQTAVNTVLESISAILHKELKPIHQPPKSNDVKDSLADITLARSIGYSPLYDLEYGLKETIRRFTNGH
jgi:UDP-glucose 4-epimerase